jgi:hypothetical protein
MGGVLDRLRQISEYLATFYGWKPSLATAFVLTGLVPLVAPITTEVRTGGTERTTARARITLTVDPTATPKEVADAYRSFRWNVLGRRRYSPQNRKHLSLAVFTCTQPAEEPWAVRLRAWNARYPQWCYGNKANFWRDCRRAEDRLLRRQFNLVVVWHDPNSPPRDLLEVPPAGPRGD